MGEAGEEVDHHGRECAVNQLGLKRGGCECLKFCYVMNLWKLYSGCAKHSCSTDPQLYAALTLQISVFRHIIIP